MKITALLFVIYTLSWFTWQLWTPEDRQFLKEHIELVFLGYLMCSFAFLTFLMALIRGHWLPR